MAQLEHKAKPSAQTSQARSSAIGPGVTADKNGAIDSRLSVYIDVVFTDEG